MFAQNQKSSHEIGINAERYVKFYLILRLYKILCSRWRNSNKKGTGLGEIDIIAKKRDTIVFIEVKARSDIESIFHSITPNQQKRIINSAVLFMSQNPQYKNYNMRFDAIFLSTTSELNNKITHIKNAFDASDIKSMIGL